MTDMQQSDGIVVLPYTKKEFGDFISSLLGKPQTINKTYHMPFELTRKDILNIFKIINQRVSQQNEAILTEFNTQISYSDNSSVTIKSIDDFISYNEVKKCM